jgi:hypothetical protein
MRRFNGLYGLMPAHRGITKSEAVENVAFPEFFGRGTHPHSNASEFSDGLEPVPEIRPCLSRWRRPAGSAFAKSVPECTSQNSWVETEKWESHELPKAARFAKTTGTGKGRDGPCRSPPLCA